MKNPSTDLTASSLSVGDSSAVDTDCTDTTRTAGTTYDSSVGASCGGLSDRVGVTESTDITLETSGLSTARVRLAESAGITSEIGGLATLGSGDRLGTAISAKTSSVGVGHTSSGPLGSNTTDQSAFIVELYHLFSVT